MNDVQNTTACVAQNMQLLEDQKSTKENLAIQPYKSVFEFLIALEHEMLLRMKLFIEKHQYKNNAPNEEVITWIQNQIEGSKKENHMLWFDAMFENCCVFVG